MPPKSTRRGRERATDRVSRLISYSLSSGAAAAAAGRSRRVHADTWRKEKWTDRALEANSHRSRRHNKTFTKSQRTPQRICRIQFFQPWSQKVVILFAFNRIVVAVWKRRRRKTKPTRRPTSTVRRRKINKTERRDGAVSSRPRRLSAASNGSARVYRNRRRTGPDLY